MKKYFYPVIAATTLMMAAACSQDDELVSGANGNEEVVSFTINTGEVATRVVGDGETVNKVHYEVWDKNTGKLVISTIETSGAMTQARAEGVSGGQATVSMSLVKGVPYDITFWAQNEEYSAYDITAGLDEIKLKDGVVANNEGYDAFCKTLYDFKVKNGASTVELKRPFAQVNVGTTPADWERAKALGVNIDKSTVTVSGIHNQFNARTTEASGTTEVTFALNSLIDETFTVADSTYQYLAMNYMLADAEKSIHDMTVTFKDGEQEINTVSVANMPIQRNWRTNIVGRVLTSDEDFEIIIVPEFEGDHNRYIWGGEVEPVTAVDGVYTITEAGQLAWIAQQVNTGNTFKDEKIVLAADLDLNSHVWTPIGLTGDVAGFQGTFDGQGHTIYNLYIDQTAERKYQSAGLFGSFRTGVIKNFTVENATVKNLDVTGNTSCGTAVVVGSAQFPATIENVTVKNAVVASNRMVGGIAGYFAGTITGCTIEGISLTATQDVLADGSKDNGDKVGAIMAYANGAVTLTDNSVSDFTINAYRDCGGVAGCVLNTESVISGNTATGGIIVYESKNAKAIVGRHNENADYETDNTSSDVIIIQAVSVANADNLVAALENGENVLFTSDIKIDPAGMSNAYGTTGINVKNGQTIDGGGHTLDIKGAGGTWDSGINTTGGLIKDLTVTGSFRGIFINHNSSHSEPVVLDGVTIDGTVYTISCDQGTNQTLKATNSTFKGWTSYAATLGSAEFDGCYFGEGSGYAYCRPYAPTTFKNCEFEAGFEMDTRAAVTFENCTLDGVALTAENLSTLVTGNIANATVK